jgi:putative FmdB family regulatory protein
MPIYAYKCESCGFAKDVLQKISDAPLSECPTCGAATFTKQLTAAGFQLKGSGWYVTDFKGGAAPAANKDGDKKEGDKPTGDKAAAPTSAPVTSDTTAAAPASPSVATSTTPVATAS